MKTLLFLSLLVATTAHAENLKVYISAAKSAEGFVVSERIEESARDIRSVLADNSHTKIYTLVDKIEDADLILEVTFSGTVPGGTFVQGGILGGNVAVAQQQMIPSMKVNLRIAGKADPVAELSHAQQLFWKDLARRIVSQFDQWVKVNAQTLANRTQKELVSPR